MSEEQTETLLSATVEVIRAALLKNETIEVPYLGTFSVQHIAGLQRSERNGRIIVIPPRNMIFFSQSDD